MANTDYWEFNNGIYPCPLCIAVGKDWHNDDFDEFCNQHLATPAMTFDTETKELGRCVLIRFESKKQMTLGYICHEAGHATMFMLDYVGSSYDSEHSEHFCYLQEWIAMCCEKVKLRKTEEE